MWDDARWTLGPVLAPWCAHLELWRRHGHDGEAPALELRRAAHLGTRDPEVDVHRPDVPRCRQCHQPVHHCLHVAHPARDDDGDVLRQHAHQDGVRSVVGELRGTEGRLVASSTAHGTRFQDDRGCASGADAFATLLQSSQLQAHVRLRTQAHSHTSSVASTHAALNGSPCSAAGAALPERRGTTCSSPAGVPSTTAASPCVAGDRQAWRSARKRARIALVTRSHSAP